MSVSEAQKPGFLVRMFPYTWQYYQTHFCSLTRFAMVYKPFPTLLACCPATARSNRNPFFSCKEKKGFEICLAVFENALQKSLRSWVQVCISLCCWSRQSHACHLPERCLKKEPSSGGAFDLTWLLLKNTRQRIKGEGRSRRILGAEVTNPTNLQLIFLIF